MVHSEVWKGWFLIFLSRSHLHNFWRMVPRTYEWTIENWINWIDSLLYKCSVRSCEWQSVAICRYYCYFIVCIEEIKTDVCCDQKSSDHKNNFGMFTPVPHPRRHCRPYLCVVTQTAYWLVIWQSRLLLHWHFYWVGVFVSENNYTTDFLLTTFTYEKILTCVFESSIYFLSCFFAILFGVDFPNIYTTKAALLMNSNFVSSSAENDLYLVRTDVFLTTFR